MIELVRYLCSLIRVYFNLSCSPRSIRDSFIWLQVASYELLITKLLVLVITLTSLSVGSYRVAGDLNPGTKWVSVQYNDSGTWNKTSYWYTTRRLIYFRLKTIIFTKQTI